MARCQYPWSQNTVIAARKEGPCQREFPSEKRDEVKMGNAPPANPLLAVWTAKINPSTLRMVMYDPLAFPSTGTDFAAVWRRSYILLGEPIWSEVENTLKAKMKRMMKRITWGERGVGRKKRRQKGEVFDELFCGSSVRLS